MAAEVNKPDFSYQWASGGAIVTPSDVKIQTGWTAEVPPFQWENYLQNRQDNAILHLFQKGISEWDAASNYYFTASGTRSYVQGSDGLIYVAVQDSVGQNPTTDLSDTYWKVAFASTGDVLLKSNNLSDIPNTATARSNLGIVSATDTVQGLIELATSAEILAGTDTTRAATAATLLAGLLAAGGNTGNDYVKIPFRDKTSGVRRDLIVQWVTVSSVGTTPVNLNGSWPLAFPTSSFCAVATCLTSTAGVFTSIVTRTTSGFTGNVSSYNANVGAIPVMIIAVGI